jgi:hypothetical protein
MLKYEHNIKEKLFLKDYPRPIKVFQLYSSIPNRVSTLDGTKDTYSENVRYANVKELLIYSLEGIMASLKLTNIEIIRTGEEYDEDIREDEEASNIDHLVT